MVDDVQVIADTVAVILNSSGFRAVAFASAASAIKAAESEPPSLLITDVNMPEMNGIELAIQFRAVYPLTKILLFSGHLATDALLKDARLRGYDFTILPKPAHPHDMLAVIKSL